VGKCVVDGHVIDAFRVRSDRQIWKLGCLRFWLRVSKFRTEPMSDASGQGSLPLQRHASTSKVLCALDSDSHFQTSDFLPDKDGTIDLTTPENNALYDAVTAQLTGRRPSNTGL
jgi:hypothetical protein